eukprot:1159943-Pelagomonas_calceolata.AAC.7
MSATCLHKPPTCTKSSHPTTTISPLSLPYVQHDSLKQILSLESLRGASEQLPFPDPTLVKLKHNEHGSGNGEAFHLTHAKHASGVKGETVPDSTMGKDARQIPQLSSQQGCNSPKILLLLSRGCIWSHRRACQPGLLTLQSKQTTRVYGLLAPSAQQALPAVLKAWVLKRQVVLRSAVLDSEHGSAS